MTRTATIAFWFAMAQIGIAQQTNIIHIIADDMGWVDIEANAMNQQFGSQFYQTPNLTQLAKDGLTFTSAYALQNCSPTRAALQSGQYNSRTHVYSVNGIEGRANSALNTPANVGSISVASTTIAEMLQGAGYTTANFGKFDVTETTAQITSSHGFDFNYGGTAMGAPGSYFPALRAGNWTCAAPISPELDQFAQPYTQAYVDSHLAPFANGNDVSTLVGTAKHLTDATTDAAISFMQAHRESGPFYMQVSFHSPHTPLESRSDLKQKYDQIIGANGNASPDSRHQNSDAAGLTEGLDQSVARLISFLHDPDGSPATDDSLAENTLVVFHGDNGPQGNLTDSLPLRGRKGSFYEGGIRVPMFAWSPTQIQPAVSDTPVHMIDFYPTFAELGGGTLPDQNVQPVDGESLVGLLSGGSAPLDRPGLFNHYPGYQLNAGIRPLSSMVTDLGDTRYKLIYTYEDRNYQLYNLKTDLSETTNLVETRMTGFEVACFGCHRRSGW